MRCECRVCKNDKEWDAMCIVKDNPKVKWKDSIKQVVGLDRPTEKGLDI